MIKNRIKSIYDKVWKDVDLIIIQNGVLPYIDKTFYYVTNLTDGIFEYSTAFLYPDFSIELLISKMEEEQVKKACLPYKLMEDGFNLKDMLKGNKKIGINADCLTYRLFSTIKRSTRAELIDVSNAIQKARMIKDEEEISRIKKSAQIASETIEEILPKIKIGIREREVAVEISYLMRRNGTNEDAFSPIAAFGKNSAKPHHSTGERRLKDRELVLLDFGGVYKRYASDITRTFVLGKPKRKQKKMYETVLDAQNLAFDKIKEGMDWSEVDDAVRRYINGTKFKGRFIHGLGHHVGLDVHDVGNPHQSLKENMVLTVEPGIYLPNYGGVRIEDMVIVKKKKCEIITTAKKELEIC